MDFSKVKKLVIPEGEVQSITIADKVVWTKPQDKTWHTIVNPTKLFANWNQYGGGSGYVALVKADLTKSKLFRFTINGSEATIRYGIDKITSTTASTGTYEVSLDAQGVTYTFSIIYEYREDNDYGYRCTAQVSITDSGEIYFDWYSSGRYSYSNWGTTITIEQFY